MELISIAVLLTVKDSITNELIIAFILEKNLADVL
jgi:hypothetical protein